MGTSRFQGGSSGAAGEFPSAFQIASDRSPAGHAVLRVSGELDLRTAGSLRRCIDDSVRATDDRLDVDLRDVTFIGLAGVRTIAEAHRDLRALGIRVHVLAGERHRPVRRVFELVGLAHLLWR